jgi:hypothetical protein
VTVKRCCAESTKTFSLQKKASILAMVSLPKSIRLVAWSTIAIACMIVFGSASEHCDIGDSTFGSGGNCSKRYKWIVAGGVIATLLSLTTFVLSFFFEGKWLSLVASCATFVVLVPVTGVASSLRTTPRSPEIIGLAMFAMFLSWFMVSQHLLRNGHPTDRTYRHDTNFTKKQFWHT